MANSNIKNFLWGFIPSVILPVIFIFTFIHFRYHGELGTLEILQELFRLNSLSSLLAISAFPNLLLFLFSMHKENWLLGRGVISATLLYGLAVMLMKLL